MKALLDPVDILIVEDNPADLYLLKKMLRSSFIKIKDIYTAERLREAHGVLNRKKVHLALLDLSLPDGYGIQSYLDIKGVSKNLPVIILTGLADTSVALEAIKQGAMDYLVKGEFNENVLTRAIQYSFERMQNKEELARQQQLKQQEITAAVLKAQERERAMLGAELHDNINQILTGVTLFLNVAISNEEKRETLLLKCRDNLLTVTQEIRKLSRKLIVPGLKSQSLVQLLQELVKDMEIGSSLPVLLDHRKLDEQLLSDEEKITVYRIAQEQLSNIQKHAEASQASFQVYTLDNEVVMNITDNGKGFDTSVRREGVGITNITSRVELHNGRIDIDTAPGKGCILHIILPLQKFLRAS